MTTTTTFTGLGEALDWLSMFSTTTLLDELGYTRTRHNDRLAILMELERRSVYFKHPLTS